MCISIKTASKSQQNALISAKNFKKISGEGAQPHPPRGLRPLARRLKSRPRSHFEKSAPMGETDCSCCTVITNRLFYNYKILCITFTESMIAKKSKFCVFYYLTLLAMLCWTGRFDFHSTTEEKTNEDQTQSFLTRVEDCHRHLIAQNSLCSQVNVSELILVINLILLRIVNSLIHLVIFSCMLKVTNIPVKCVTRSSHT